MRPGRLLHSLGRIASNRQSRYFLLVAAAGLAVGHDKADWVFRQLVACGRSDQTGAARRCAQRISDPIAGLRTGFCG